MKIKKLKKNNYNTMKRIINLFVILALAIGFTACGKKQEKKEAEKKLSLVKVRDIKGEEFSEVYKIIGIVKPYASAKLSSEEGGIISYLTKDKGSSVRKGETIAVLKKDFDKATYDQALSQYELARDNFERAEKLYRENATTEQVYTSAKLQFNIAEKTVEMYRTRLTKGYIISPIGGIVDAKYMNLGEMTSPGAPIVSIVDVSKVKIEAGIPEKYVTRLSKGRIVDITFDVLPDEKFSGKISYISPTLNPQSRTFDIEIVIDNKGRKLKPEMSANVFFTNMDLDEAVVLERDVFVDNGDEQFVFVLDNDIAKKKIVKIGGTSDNKVLISEGLNIGDKLIYYGFRALVDGDKVKVVSE
ncbi:MAG: efflux RND transporter periplasmic adaptor subunit [Ignavibacteriae bacterium]|nr:efflux RND transporter periplasmic adaptor subunit [Ignavibacteriota bacterium]